MEKIKVLTIITKLELGGAQKVALYIANNLGNEFESYFISGETAILDDTKTQDYKNIKIFFNVPSLIRSINPLKDLLCFLKLVSLIKKIKPKVVHTHSSKAGIIGRFAAFFCKIPVVIHTYHGFGFNDFQSFFVKKIYILLEKLSSLKATKLVFVSNVNLKKAHKEKIGNTKQYEIIRCGIDLKKYRNTMINVFEKKQTLGIPTNLKTIGMIACFKPQKAPLDFIEIANKLLAKRKDLFFVMLGDGILHQEIETKIQEYGINNNVKLLGWRDDVNEVLQTFDVFALTSLWEGLPMAVLEAMATGIPVVATRIDGTQEVIHDNENGFLINCHDVENFAKKIEILLENEDLKIKFTTISQTILSQEFDEKNVIETTKKLYKNCLEKFTKK